MIILSNPMAKLISYYDGREGRSVLGDEAGGHHGDQREQVGLALSGELVNLELLHTHSLVDAFGDVDLVLQQGGLVVLLVQLQLARGKFELEILLELGGSLVVLDALLLLLELPLHLLDLELGLPVEFGQLEFVLLGIVVGLLLVSLDHLSVAGQQLLGLVEFIDLGDLHVGFCLHGGDLLVAFHFDFLGLEVSVLPEFGLEVLE
jgi:hypothetical protein